MELNLQFTVIDINELKFKKNELYIFIIQPKIEISPNCATKENIIAKRKYFSFKKNSKFNSPIALTIPPIKKTDSIEKKKEPITPDKVLLGLILVNFFHLKTFPKT